ncbi:UvrD-helicase domain-containing protein [Curtobacterium sp. MCBA15_009]|uniref:UvrD-helicase domain-containing protein n=1 Tax=Curtobacterium sp. MCBA15_009 TaxID=1898737 RepID=UPI000AC91A6F|nr:UvrD-helicase domain-containing protein [Curtobacterium sp. MCBA15_009]
MSRRIDSPDTPADLRLRELLEGDTPPCFVVNAGAGSGKTTSLVKALAHLRDAKGSQLRRQGQKVACITYTEVAAEEIHGEVDLDPVFHVSTIHSFLWTVVRPFRRDIALWVDRRIEGKIAALLEHNSKKGTRGSTITKNDALIARLEADRAALTPETTFTYGIGSRYARGVLGHDDVIKMVPELLMEKSLLRRLLAHQYPFVFVDESQDTFPSVVAALKAIAADPTCAISIGFLGDEMQQIYSTGIGSIPIEPDWAQIDKPENFRCPSMILEVINNIRGGVPGSLKQTGGRRDAVTGKTLLGDAKLFVLASTGDRDSQLQEVRAIMANSTTDSNWRVEDGSPSAPRVLVIEHRLAARRLGFEQIFASHHDRSTDRLKEGISEGTAWSIQPFVSYLTPLALAVRRGDSYAQMELVRANSPLDLERTPALASRLSSLSAATEEISNLMRPDSDATVRTLLSHALSSGLWALDDNFSPYEQLLNYAATHESVGDSVEHGVLARFFDCPARELLAYQSYLDEHSVFATHQGVKGAEFERVLVLLEDDAAVGNSFSYEKLFELRELSATDLDHISNGRESTLDRTRRLLYVVCSRAERSLAVALFTPSAMEAVSQVRKLGLFRPENVITF